MSLEVDRRDDLPIPQDGHKGALANEAEKQVQDPMHSTRDDGFQKPTPEHQHRGERKTILFLSAALVFMSILAIIAAAVGGSIATKRAHKRIMIRIAPLSEG